MKKTNEKISNIEGDLHFPKSSNNPVFDWIIRVLKGMAIGIGGILPGLSGGVLSVIFGVYDNIISFLANPFKKLAKNIKFFLPIGIGGVLGIFVFSKVVSSALLNYQTIAVSLFLGFVAGTLPSLYKQAGVMGRKRANIFTMFITAIAFMMIMTFADRYLSLNLPSNPFVWLFSGVLIGLGVIVPGLSPSNFLLYFNLYEKMTSGISSLDFSIIIPLAIGLILCLILFAKLAEFLFNKYYAATYHIIIGLVLGSTIAIIFTHVLSGMTVEAANKANMSLTLLIFAVTIAFALGTVSSYLFSKLEEKVDSENSEA